VIAQRLSGGDRRSIGQADAVAAEVLAAPRLMGQVIDALASPDPIVRMRAADVAEKVSARKPGWLQLYKRPLLALMRTTEQAELRWHLAQMAPRLDLTRKQSREVETILFAYLHDGSRIVQAFSLQALADLAERDPRLRRRLLGRLRGLANRGSAAVRVRARRILARWKGV
jgi:hypothetical protein